MNGALFATTPRSALHALAFQGIMASSSHAQIMDMLRRGLDEKSALLFARPAFNEAGGEIDWYAPAPGEVRKLESLPPEERQRALARFSEIAKDIENYADELIASGEPLKTTRGNILKLALRYPDDSALYVLNGEPLLTCWGFGPAEPGVEPKDLSRLAHAASLKAMPAPTAGPALNKEEPGPIPARPALAAAPAAAWNLAWLWWLLPFLLLLLLLLLLFSNIGYINSLAGKSLYSLPAPKFLKEPKDFSAEIAELENLVARQSAELARKAELCQPAQAPARAESRMTPRAEENIPEEEKLVIPEEARDPSFLKGRWRCETGLFSSRTDEPVVVEFSFDAEGNGEGQIHEKNDVCEGAAKASMQNGALRVDLAEQRCARGDNGYSNMSIECSGAGGREAECLGLNADGTSWRARFRRIE